MTTTRQLGTIERIDDIRSIWPSEPQNFTPWLANNLDELGRALNMELELTSTEAPVGDGNLSLDILALETSTNNVVAIENQITSADHGHIGQLLTYAAGHKANIVIWTATHFRDEYKAALDWLNEHTDDSLEFYGVEIDVVRIGDSTPAPLLQPVVVPNSWSKSASVSIQPVSEKGEQYRRFWQPLLERLNREHHWGVKTDNTASLFAAGSGIAELWRYMRFYVLDRKVAVELSLQTPNKDWNKSFFDLLKESQEEIEAELGVELLWERLDNNKTSRVGIRRVGSIDADPSELDEIREWMFHNVVRFKEVFPSYLREVRDRLPRP